MNFDAERTNALERGRAAYARNAWLEAYVQLSTADRAIPLEPDDLQRLATTAYLLGRDAQGDELLARAHRDFLDRGEIERAVRCAYWMGHSLMFRGEPARAGGWLARAQRLMDDVPHDSVERGYLRFPIALKAVMSGDFEAANATFREVAEIAIKFGDRTLVAMARMGQGRALIKLGDVPSGTTLLDEAMVAIEAGDVQPIITGVVYCSVLEACSEIFDLRRAQEWTGSLSRWCEAQPDLVPFRGMCLIYRAELLQLHGDWLHALTEAQSARERLSNPPPPQPAVGGAQYQEAELHRLRGEFAEAEAAYRESSKWSRKPRPGMALLRLAQGQLDAATSSIRILLQEARTTDTRPKVLAAWAEIALATGELAAARAAADELSSIASEVDATMLHAMAAHADGAVLLAEGKASAALSALRQAWSVWEQLEAPYECARVRVLLGLACRALGDHDAAAMELDAARWTFEQLGAAPDIARMDALSPAGSPASVSGLTARELEVLRLVAKGKSNKAIALELFISEKTVHRHVSNIFLKLQLSSRAAATAYAFQHNLT
jgi:DNA-binding CsgD family transcriptional regulator